MPPVSDTVAWTAREAISRTPPLDVVRLNLIIFTPVGEYWFPPWGKIVMLLRLVT